MHGGVCVHGGGTPPPPHSILEVDFVETFDDPAQAFCSALAKEESATCLKILPVVHEAESDNGLVARPQQVALHLPHLRCLPDNAAVDLRLVAQTDRGCMVQDDNLRLEHPCSLGAQGGVQQHHAFPERCLFECILLHEGAQAERSGLTALDTLDLHPLVMDCLHEHRLELAALVRP